MAGPERHRGTSLDAGGRRRACPESPPLAGRGGTRRGGARGRSVTGAGARDHGSRRRPRLRVHALAAVVPAGSSVRFVVTNRGTRARLRREEEAHAHPAPGTEPDAHGFVSAQGHVPLPLLRPGPCAPGHEGPVRRLGKATAATAAGEASDRHVRPRLADSRRHFDRSRPGDGPARRPRAGFRRRAVRDRACRSRRRRRSRMPFLDIRDKVTLQGESGSPLDRVRSRLRGERAPLRDSTTRVEGPYGDLADRRVPREIRSTAISPIRRTSARC